VSWCVLVLGVDITYHDEGHEEFPSFGHVYGPFTEQEAKKVWKNTGKKYLHSLSGVYEMERPL
jgi:hypothetical protein